MGLSEDEAAQLAALTAKAAQPDDTVVVSDAAVVAQAEAAVEIAQIQADAAVEQTRIVEESSVARAEAYADEAQAAATDDERIADAENTAAIALAIAVETATVVADQAAGGGDGDASPTGDGEGTGTSAGDASSGGGDAPAAADTAAGDEPPGTKHEQPHPGEGTKKPHWYERTIGGH